MLGSGLKPGITGLSKNAMICPRGLGPGPCPTAMIVEALRRWQSAVGLSIESTGSDFETFLGLRGQLRLVTSLKAVSKRFDLPPPACSSRRPAARGTVASGTVAKTSCVPGVSGIGVSAMPRRLPKASARRRGRGHLAVPGVRHVLNRARSNLGARRYAVHRRADRARHETR